MTLPGISGISVALPTGRKDSKIGGPLPAPVLFCVIIRIFMSASRTRSRIFPRTDSSPEIFSASPLCFRLLIAKRFALLVESLSIHTSRQASRGRQIIQSSTEIVGRFLNRSSNAEAAVRINAQRKWQVVLGQCLWRKESSSLDLAGRDYTI
eukprot:441981_1